MEVRLVRGLALFRMNFLSSLQARILKVKGSLGSMRYLLTSIKNNCLKLKNEVGMEVLKSKQTRVVYRDNQHIRIVHPYACFLIGPSDCVILLYTSIHQYS